MSTSLPTTTDVLVVGAGPTGLALAIALRRLGVQATVLDLAGEVSDTTRAAGVQPRTLEDLARLGAADALISQGIQGKGFRASATEGTLLEIDFSTLSTPFPYVLLVPQSVTEQVLRDTLAGAGGSLLPRHRLLSFEEEFDAVTALVADESGIVHVIRAAYLVGCDGLHSGVRTRLGTPFTGTDQGQNFALADVRLASPAQPLVHFTFSAQGLLLRSALPGDALRVVATASPTAQPLDLAGIRDLIARRAGDDGSPTVTEVLHSSVYRVSSRLADSFGEGRVFLAGDAAHVHSPAGGQGMNTGIQDAVNLSWKIAEVLEGAEPSLLASYDAERRPNAANVLGITGQITALAKLTNPTLSALRDDLLQAAGALPTFPALMANTLSQLDISYGTSAAPAGQRLPISDPPPVGLKCTTATLHDGRTVKVRPDGYIDAGLSQ